MLIVNSMRNVWQEPQERRRKQQQQSAGRTGTEIHREMRNYGPTSYPMIMNARDPSYACEFLSLYGRSFGARGSDAPGYNVMAVGF